MRKIREVYQERTTILFVLLLGALVFIHQSRFDWATPYSRLALLHALVGKRTLCIDDFPNTPDRARYNGHYYSDKAPGTAALALPAFWIAAKVGQSCGIQLESRRGWLITSWAACAFSQAFPAAVGGTLLFLWLCRFVRPRVALLTVAGLWLGGIPLPYSTWLYSHAQVIGLIAIAIWAMDLFGDGVEGGADSFPAWDRGTIRWRMALAGFCLGLALASEYTAGLVVVGLGLYVLWKRRSGLVPFVLGAVPPLLLIPAYSWATIGTPFDLPYSYQASFPQMKKGIYSIQWPSLEIMGLLLLSPSRGFIFWTPLLLLVGVGWRLCTQRHPKWLWWVYVLPLLDILIISGKRWDWQAGYTLSARYLSPLLPLLALPCAMGVQQWPKVGAVLAGVSIGMMSLATVTTACVPYEPFYPLFQLHVPKFLHGEFSYNLLADSLGWPRWIGVFAFYGFLLGGIYWSWKKAELK